MKFDTLLSSLQSKLPFFSSAKGLVVLMLSAYIALAIPYFDAPDIENEEAFPVAIAMENLHGQAYYEVYKGVRVGGVLFPFLYNDHKGTVLDYVMFPFLALFGVNVVTVRLGEILLSLLAVFLAAALVFKIAGRRTALVTLFLFLFHSGVFIFSKQSFIGDVVTMQLCVIASAWAFWKWMNVPSRRSAFILGLILGFSIYVKLYLLWQALVYSGALVYLHHKRTRRLFGGELFMLGAGILLSPYVLINILTGGAEVLGSAKIWVERHFSMGTTAPNWEGGGAKPFEYVLKRLYILFASLAHFPYKPQPAWFWMILMGGGYGFIFWALWKRDNKPKVRAMVNIWLLVALVHSVMVLAPLEYGIEPILPMLPLMLMALGISITHSLKSLPSLLLVLGVFYMGHFVAIGEYFRDCRTWKWVDTGDIGDYLLSHGITRPYSLMHVGDTSELAIQTAGRVRPHSYTNGSVSIQEVFRKWQEDPQRWYTHWAPGSRLARIRGLRNVDLFLQTARESQKKEKDVAYIHSHEGTPIFKIFRLE